jgi:hypothetical protein
MVVHFRELGGELRARSAPRRPFDVHRGVRQWIVALTSCSSHTRNARTVSACVTWTNPTISRWATSCIA